MGYRFGFSPGIAPHHFPLGSPTTPTPPHPTPSGTNLDEEGESGELSDLMTRGLGFRLV